MNQALTPENAQAVATAGFSGLERSLTPKGKKYAKAMIRKAVEKRRAHRAAANAGTS